MSSNDRITEVAALIFAANLVGCATQLDTTTDTAEQSVVIDESGGCDPGPQAPAPRPQSCQLADAACGWGNALFVAQELYSQMTPGCGPVEGTVTVIVDGLGTDWEEPTEAAAVWACNVLSCLPPSNPYVAAAQATCAGGNALAAIIRCETYKAECAHDLAMAVGIGCEGIAAHYPCPYSPSVAACDGDQPRDENAILRDCGNVVSGYPVSGPTAGQCVASCVNATRDASAGCGS